METGSVFLMREMNSRIVFGLIRGGCCTSRVDLSRKTGLSRSTVSSIVDELISHRLIRECGPGESVAVGRKPTLLEVVPEAAHFLAFHVEDDGVISGTLTDLRLSRLITVDGECRDQKSLCATLVDLTHHLLAQAGVQVGRVWGMGVSLPGLVDTDAGRILLAVQMNWRNVEVSSQLEQEFDFPVVVENSARAAAIGERRFGQGRNVRSFIHLRVGSGVGAGIFLDGRLHRGTNGMAGEIGHTVVPGVSLRCGCGRIGCLRTVLSEPAVIAQAQAGFERMSPTHLARWSVEPNRLSPSAVTALADAGEEVTASLLTSAGGFLGVSLGNLVNVLDLKTVILAGPLTRSRVFLQAVRERVNSEILSIPGNTIEVTSSDLGLEGILRGAASLVSDKVLGKIPHVPLGEAKHENVSGAPHRVPAIHRS